MKSSLKKYGGHNYTIIMVWRAWARSKNMAADRNSFEEFSSRANASLGDEGMVSSKAT